MNVGKNLNQVEKINVRKGGRNMKRKWIPLVILLTVVLVPGLVFGASYKGTIQGFLCVTSGITCPVGKEDVVAAAENVFVLYEGPDKWYFISNVDSKLLARGINKTVMIEGMLDQKSNSINAETISLMEDGKWRKVWSADLMDDLYEDVLGAHPLKGGQ